MCSLVDGGKSVGVCELMVEYLQVGCFYMLFHRRLARQATAGRETGERLEPWWREE